MTRMQRRCFPVMPCWIWSQGPGCSAVCRAAQGRETYLYEFDADIPGEDQAGSYHGSEMWFAYDSLARCWRPFTGRHYDLARQVSSYWVNFVKNGNPNGTDTIGEELPEWKSYTAENDFCDGIYGQTG